MPRYFAFLRAINVGGHTVKMDHLRSLFTSLDLQGVETFIASGNVIFDSKVRNARSLENRIEKHLYASLGYEVATFLRTEKELLDISSYKPFDEQLLKTAIAINVGFVADPLSDDVAKALGPLNSEIDRFHVHNREMYWMSRMKQSDSKFSNAVFERMLKGKATFRGMNTILRMAAKYITN